ncbi:MAG TPA: penicillin acylase family protein [Candidatus Thermoplasmatota archaeon]|nr:penicillin acylase family protein [Candidatus Thermoplasmatota archaeon]
MQPRRTIASVLFALILATPAMALPLPARDALEAHEVGGETVTIKRDAWGVPHVYADSAYGVFWGNGYAQAQDRLFQMDVLRHVGKGESARYLGPSQLEMDLVTRRELYTDEERQARWDALPAEQQAMFQGFADGVNAWIQKVALDPTLLSAEFYAIGHFPEPWVATDTIAIAEFLLDIFGAGSGGNELRNAQVYLHLVETLGVEEARKAFDDFFWLQDPTTYTTIDPAEYTYAATEELPGWENIPEEQWALIEAAAGAVPFAGPMDVLETVQHALGGFHFGSNAVVLGPQFAQSNSALLLGGPQMAYHNPMVPYEVALHGGGYDAVGMGVGGAPGVIIGRNTHLAWTVTSGSSDQVDVVAERLVPGNPRQYYDGETVRDMDCRLEVHHGLPTAIDQKPPVLATQEVCRTARGPVFAINEEAGYAFVRERTHRLDELRSGILWLTLAQNTDMDSFAAHMETFCFEFNFHVAQDNGDIGYYHFGCNPDRASGYDPRFPRLAGAHDWVGIRSGSELPHIKNPEKGYIVNWNNKPAQGWSSGDAMEKWGPVHRAELFESVVAEYIATHGKLTAAHLDEINERISTNSPFPTNYAQDLAAATAALTGTPGQAAALMQAWIASGEHWIPGGATCVVARAPSPCFGTYEPGFIIYEEWRKVAHERAFRDELGPHVRELGFVPELSSDPHAADHGREDNKENVLFRALHGGTQHDWLDESKESFLLASFLEAVARLETRFGSSDAEAWREPTRTIKFVALSGGPAWRIPMVNRPSFNHFYDFGTGEAGSVMPPGTDQSWEPLAFLEYQATGDVAAGGPHKRDQLDLYAAFAWKPATLAPAVWESEETLTLGASLVP